MALTGYSLSNGAVVWIDINDSDDGQANEKPEYGREDVGAGKASRVVASFEDALAPLEEVTNSLLSKLNGAAQKPTDVTLEFGVNLKGTAGIQIVSGEVGAEIRVTLSWTTGSG